MLKKLFKYEWKAVWRFMAAINAFMLLLTLIGCIGTIFIRWDSGYSLILNVLGGTYVTTYTLALVGLIFATVIYLAVRYYRTMYGDEGYLTHTLPATPLQLILSKGFVAAIWLTVGTVVTCLSMYALAVSSMISDGRGFTSMNYFIDSINWYLNRAGLSLAGFSAMVVIYLILLLIFTVLMMYAPCALGQLLGKHRGMGAIGFYFGISMVSQIIITIIFVAGSFRISKYDMSTVMGINKAVIHVYLLLLVPMIFENVLLFLLTYLPTQKKLNLL